MPESIKCLLVGSTESYSGKSAAILGMAQQLLKKGIDIAYGKPIGTCLSESGVDTVDEDVRFIAQTLGLSPNRLGRTLLSLDGATIAKRIAGNDPSDYRLQLQGYPLTPGADLVLLEGTGTLEEGRLFGLSLIDVAEAMAAGVVLVSRFHSGLIVDGLLAAKQQLGDRLLGALINDIPLESMEFVGTQVKPFLEQHGIEVLGMLPRSDILRSISVSELVHQLNAQVLCRPDRLDLMVESLKIGAMNVNSALKYFRQAHNMAVVTGGDRTDIQLAALETSTHCLILTGQIPPSKAVLSRAEDLEIPILSVEFDTLTTVEIIDRTFGQVRLHEPLKVQCVQELMEKHFDIDRLMGLLNLGTATTV